MTEIKKSYNKKVQKKTLTSDGIEIITAKLNFLFYEAHEKLLPFDRKFLASLIKQVKFKPALSIKQFNKLDEIYERVAPGYASENRLNENSLWTSFRNL